VDLEVARACPALNSGPCYRGLDGPLLDQTVARDAAITPPNTAAKPGDVLASDRGWVLGSGPARGRGLGPLGLRAFSGGKQRRSSECLVRGRDGRIARAVARNGIEMKPPMVRVLGIVALGSLLGSCAEQHVDSEPNRSTGGAAASGGTGPTGGGSTSSPPVSCNLAATPVGPGSLLSDLASPGTGQCTTTPGTQFLQAIFAQQPDLSDITQLYSPMLMGDGSWVYLYVPPEGGFRMILKRGSGDCPAGCINNEYWYFEADGACQPRLVGHYRRTFDDSGNCFAIEGTPLWNTPAATDPAYACGADLSPAIIAGTYRVAACGKLSPCSTSGQPEGFGAVLSLKLAQDGSDPSRGTLTLTGTGDSFLEGRALPATFQRRRVAVDLESNNLPSRCPEMHTVQVAYDLEGIAAGSLVHSWLLAPDCAVPDQDCKGELWVELGAPQ
jgi:hypothetical protein